MGGVQEDDAHAGPDGIADAVNDVVAHIAMGGVAPPDQHVGLGQFRGRQAVVGVLQGDGRGGHGGVAVQRVGDGGVHALRVDPCHDAVLAFVDVLAPDGDANGHGTLL